MNAAPDPQPSFTLAELLEHRAWVSHLAHALTRDPSEADDLEQEAWLSALRNPPRRDTRGSSPRGWFGTVLRNAAKKRIRSEVRRDRREIACARNEAGTGTDETLERLELEQQVVDRLVLLDDPYRRALLLRYFHDRNTSEIAELEGISVNTAKTRLRRARERLREKLVREVPRVWSGLLMLPFSGGASGTVAATTVSTAIPAAVTMTWGGFLMSGKVTVLVSLFAAALVGSTLYLYGEWSEAERRLGARDSELAALRAASPEGMDQERRDSDRSEWLREQSRLRDQIESLRESLALASRKAGESEDSALEPRARAARDRATALVSLQNAETTLGTVEELVERSDLEGLWLLASELIQHGEPGYELLIEIARQLDEEKMREAKRLWRSEEVLAGRFLRAIDRNIDDVLRLGLYLESKPKQEVPDLLQEFQKELNHEAGVMLLGLYDGDDVELLDQYVALFEQKLAGDLSKSHRVMDWVRALSQITTDRSVEVLASVYDRGDPRLRAAVVEACAFQGHSSAVALLTQWRQEEEDEDLLEKIELALRYLE